MRGDCFRCVYFESHRCANRWVGDRPCPNGKKFIEYTGSEVKQCILATVEIFQDGYMHCPVLDCNGCEYCYERMEEDGYEFYRDERQNYKRLPRTKQPILRNERSKSMIQNISIDKLFPHPNNPRKNLGDLTELAESIKAQGILQNLTVVPQQSGYCPSCNLYNPGVGKCNEGHDKTERPPCSKWESRGNFTVIIGHRRLAAAKLAGFAEVPCAIAGMDDRTQIATMLLENIQRADLTIMEQAEGFQMMIDLGESVVGIASKTGFSESTVKHRIKLNDLDKKKLSEASMRGGRIEDFIALEKIKDAKVRDRLLGDVGTKNFDWNLKCAIKEQEKPERKKAIVCKLNKFAKPVKESNGLTCITSWYEFEGKVDKPKDAGTVEYFYTIDNYRATLYKKPSEKEKVKEMSPKEKSFNERKAQLEQLAKQAFESRYAFVKGFTGAKKHAAEIRAFAFKRWIYGGSLNVEKALRLLAVGDTTNADWSMKRELLEGNYYGNPEQTLLCIAYCYGDDGAHSDYHYAQSWDGYKITWQKNSTLDALYDGLISLGYEMSEEEQQLRDGTHILFDWTDKPAEKKPAEETEEPDDDEETEDENE
jgi:ParB family chromosome partitioning protein